MYSLCNFRWHVCVNTFFWDALYYVELVLSQRATCCSSPTPKVVKFYFRSKRCAMFWNVCKTNFTFFVWQNCNFKFLVTWFRDANKWFPTNSWLGGFQSKASRAWGRSSPYLKKKKSSKDNLNFFPNFFFRQIFFCLRIVWNVCIQLFIKIGAKNVLLRFWWFLLILRINFLNVVN